MLNFNLYSIYVTTSPERACDKEFFLTFDEAMAARTKYANWRKPNGDVYICQYFNGVLTPVKVWHVNEQGETCFVR